MDIRSIKVMSLRSFSCFREAPSTSIFNSRRRSSSANFLAFLNMTYYSTISSNEFFPSSKRRSHGPVMAAKKASKGEKLEDGKYKHTVDLPKTKFGMRANSTSREPEIQKLWEEIQVFKRL